MNRNEELKRLIEHYGVVALIRAMKDVSEEKISDCNLYPSKGSDIWKPWWEQLQSSSESLLKEFQDRNSQY